MRKKTEAIVLIALYLFMLWLWTIPIRDNPVPYGEPDAAIHYRLFDEWYTRDKISIYEPRVSEALGFRKERTINGQPPAFHMGIAMQEILLNDRFLVPYIHIFIICSLIFFTLYFLVRKFYGSLTATMTSIFIILSVRDILTYIWGQWATAEAIAFIPIILYALYKAKEVKYFYIFIVLLACQLLIHPAIFSLTVMIVIVYWLLMIITKQYAFCKFKNVFFGGLLLIAIFLTLAPLQVSYTASRFARGFNLIELEENIVVLKEDYDTGLKRLFGWYNIPYDLTGNYSPLWFHYGSIYGVPPIKNIPSIFLRYWTLPFLIIGVVLLILNHRRMDLLMLSTLLGFYIMLHLDLVGWFPDPKITRLFFAESVIFFPFIAIGLTQWTKSRLKYITVGGALLFLVLFVFPLRFEHFSEAYDLEKRLNAPQFEMANWIYDNTADNATIFYLGLPTFPQRAWFQSISSRYGVFDDNLITNSTEKTDYVLMDMSYHMNNPDAMNFFNAVHETLGPQLVYDNTYLRLYKVR